MQDLLGLGREARMNRPGIAGGNWSFRLLPGQLDAKLAELRVRFKELVRELKFVGKATPPP